MNAALSGPNITLQGRRKEVLSPLTVGQFRQHTATKWPVVKLQLKTQKIFDRVELTQVTEEDSVKFLALKLISGPYAFSMEATCPKGERGRHSALLKTKTSTGWP